MKRDCIRLSLCGIIVLATVSMASEKLAPIELGKITWLRDFDMGMAKAKKEKKPVLLLFQEVPG
jgi:hypothetical protein